MRSASSTVEETVGNLKMHPAGQPEILRAAQRDETFLGQFHETVTGLLQGVLGIRTWIKFRDYIRIASELTYYSLTTLSNRQTLGEEYTGIFQTHSSGKSLQPKDVQIIMILLNACGENLFIYILKKFENHIKSLPEEHPLLPHAREKMIQTSEHLRSIIPFVQRLHKAVFYLNSEYYEIGKRLTRTRYMLVRYWMKDRSNLPAFRLLGLISFIHLTLHSLLAGVRLKKSSGERVDGANPKPNEVVSSRNVCPLCLNNRKNTSSISCGHLFCWDCIISWLQERAQCPLCRKSAQASRVILLQNY